MISLMQQYKPFLLKLLFVGLVSSFLLSFYSTNTEQKLVNYRTNEINQINKLVQKDIEPTTVLFVPHSHCDAGWLKTFEEYYDSKVNAILDSVIVELEKDIKKRFIWSEISYFSDWWDYQSDNTKNKVIKFIENGQLEFVGGGWVQNDEAVSNIDDVIDQITEGHLWIKKQFNKTVDYAWQIDPFGHSSLSPTLFSQMGFKAMIGNRISDNLKENLRNYQQLDFIWEGSAVLGEKSRMFVHILNYHYGYPKNFYDLEQPFSMFQSDIVGIVQKMESLIDDYRTATLSNIVMIPWGDDFTYADAADEFRRADLLIEHLNDDRERMNIKEVRYATLSEYFNLLFDDYLQRSLPLPLFKNDFFPYVTDETDPWTGYFTSHTLFKREIRETSSLIRATDIFYSLAVAKSSSFSLENHKKMSTLLPDLDQARHNLAITQHHDSVTGTARSYVMNDYFVKLQEAKSLSEFVLVNSLEYLRTINANIRTDSPMNLMSVFDIDWLVGKENKAAYSIVLTNTLAWNRIGHVSIRVKSTKLETVGKLQIIDGTTMKPVQVQALPVNLQLNCHNNEYEYLLFFISSTPSVGVSTYYMTLNTVETQSIWSTVSESSRSLDKNSNILENQYLQVKFNEMGHISSILKKLQSNNSKSIDFIETVQQYTTKKSGAYIFLPNDKKTVDGENKIFYYINGPLFNQILSFGYTDDVCTPKTVIMHRLYKSDSVNNSSDTQLNYEKLVEVGYSVPGEGNRETVFNFQTNLKSGRKFFTDNGLESRTRYLLKNSNLVQFQYYPVLGSAHIYDENMQFTIFTERSHGVTSIDEGNLEIMVHRTLLQDDSKGLSFPNKDYARIDGKFYLYLDSIENSRNFGKQISLAIQNPPIQLLQPFNNLEEEHIKYRTRFSFFNSSIPFNLHLYSLKFNNRYDLNGSPLINMRIGDIQAKQDTTPQALDYQSLFTQDISIRNQSKLGLNLLSYREPYALLFKNLKRTFASMKSNYTDQGSSEIRSTTPSSMSLENEISPLEIKSFEMILHFDVNNVTSHNSNLTTDRQMIQDGEVPLPYLMVAKPDTLKSSLSNNLSPRYPYDFSVYRLDLSYNNDSGEKKDVNIGVLVGISFVAAVTIGCIILVIVVQIRRRNKLNNINIHEKFPINTYQKPIDSPSQLQLPTKIVEEERVEIDSNNSSSNSLDELIKKDDNNHVIDL